MIKIGLHPQQHFYEHSACLIQRQVQMLIDRRPPVHTGSKASGVLLAQNNLSRLFAMLNSFLIVFGEQQLLWGHAHARIHVASILIQSSALWKIALQAKGYIHLSSYYNQAVCFEPYIMVEYIHGCTERTQCLDSLERQELFPL